MQLSAYRLGGGWAADRALIMCAARTTSAPRTSSSRRRPSALTSPCASYSSPSRWGRSWCLPRRAGHRDTQYLADLIAARSITCCSFVPSQLEVFLQVRSPAMQKPEHELLAFALPSFHLVHSSRLQHSCPTTRRCHIPARMLQQNLVDTVLSGWLQPFSACRRQFSRFPLSFLLLSLEAAQLSGVGLEFVCDVM